MNERGVGGRRGEGVGVHRARPPGLNSAATAGMVWEVSKEQYAVL